jgi:hypothetical protein
MDTVTATLLLLGSALASIAGNIVANELYDRSHTFSCWLIKRAVSRLPEHQRERYREEWIAHIGELSGQLGKILHAAGCCFAAAALAKTKASNTCDSYLVISIRGTRCECIRVTRCGKPTLNDLKWLARTIQKFLQRGDYQFRLGVERMVLQDMEPLDK